MSRASRSLLVAAALFSGICAAQEQPRPQSQFSYTYVELTYDETDFKIAGNELDGDGFTLAGSLELTEEWHAYLSYGDADLDFGIDLATWAIGAGYRYPLKNNLDVYGRLLYIDTDIDVPGGSRGDDGLGLLARLRARVTDELELEGGIQHVDVGDSDTSLRGEARYYFRSNFSAGVGLTLGGDSDGISVSARLTF